MNKTEFGLGAAVLDSIRAVFTVHSEVEKVILYGSRAKGNYKVGSDIDLTMKGEDLDFSVLSTISQELYDLPIPYMVDLSIFSNITNENLVEHIERVGKEFYRKKPMKISPERVTSLFQAIAKNLEYSRTGTSNEQAL